MSNLFYEKTEGIIKYLKENGISTDKIFFSRNLVDSSASKSSLNGKERIVMNLVSKAKNIESIEDTLSDLFTERSFVGINKTSATEMKFTVLEEDIFNNDNSISHKDFKRSLDTIIKTLKDDKDASINIKEYTKVVEKKWYEKGWLMGLFSIFLPPLGALMIFLNKYLPFMKKLLLGLLALAWGAFAYFGLIKGKLFSPKNLVNTQIEKIENVKEEITGKAGEVSEETKAKTANIMSTIEDKLKDIIARKDLSLEKISDKEVKLIAHSNVSFNTNDADLHPEFQGILTVLTAILKEHDEYKISIDGFTDNTGTDEINNKLSLERAEHVANYFKQNGISEDRITFKGNGSKDPIATNDTEEGKKENRRIEMRIFSK